MAITKHCFAIIVPVLIYLSAPVSSSATASLPAESKSPTSQTTSAAETSSVISSTDSESTTLETSTVTKSATTSSILTSVTLSQSSTSPTASETTFSTSQTISSTETSSVISSTDSESTTLSTSTVTKSAPTSSISTSETLSQSSTSPTASETTLSTTQTTSAAETSSIISFTDSESITLATSTVTISATSSSKSTSETLSQSSTSPTASKTTLSTSQTTSAAETSSVLSSTDSEYTTLTTATEMISETTFSISSSETLSISSASRTVCTAISSTPLTTSATESTAVMSSTNLENATLTTSTAMISATTSSISSPKTLSTISRPNDIETIHLEKDKFPISLTFNIKFLKNFTENLNTPTSEEYLKLKNAATYLLNETFHDMKNFITIEVKRFRNGSVICDFDIKFKGSSNLTALAMEFSQAVNEMPNNTTAGKDELLHIISNTTELINSFNKAASIQENGNVCEIYEDIAYCRLGYICTDSESDFIECDHVCTTNTALCKNGGVCFFDHLTDKSSCRCKPDEDYVYSGETCDIKTEKLALSSMYIISIAAGGGGALILTLMIALVVLALRRRRDSKKNSEKIGESGSSSKDYPDENGVGNIDLWDLPSTDKKSTYGEVFKETDMPMYIRGREHKVVRDQNGSEAYIYQPSQYSTLNHRVSACESNQSSSLVDLHFPDSPFEIQRPSLRQSFLTQL